MNKKVVRLEYLDLMKGIGIFFVVWAHTICPIKDWIYSFHMPLFFITSGLFLSIRLGFKEFVLKKARQLLIPFVTFNLLGVLAQLLVSICVEHQSLMTFSFREEIGFGYLKGDLYFPNRVTWFLWSLFFISVLVYSFSRLFESRWILLLVSLGLYFLSLFLVDRVGQLPFFINSIFCGQFFFVVGYVGKDWILKAIEYKGYHWIALLLFVYVLSYIFLPTTADYILGIVKGNPMIHIVQCLTVLYLIAYICRRIKRLPFFSFWGVNSLYMLGLNLPLLCLIDYGYFLIFDRSEITAFGGVCVIFLLAYPIYYLLNRFVPFALGKSK